MGGGQSFSNHHPRKIKKNTEKPNKKYKISKSNKNSKSLNTTKKAMHKNSNIEANMLSNNSNGANQKVESLKYEIKKLTSQEKEESK